MRRSQGRLACDAFRDSRQAGRSGGGCDGRLAIDPLAKSPEDEFLLLDQAAMPRAGDDVEYGIRNPCGQPMRVGDRDEQVPVTMQDQRGGGDAAEVAVAVV